MRTDPKDPDLDYHNITPKGNVGFRFVIKAEPKNITQWGNQGQSAFQGAVHQAARWLLADDKGTPINFFIDSRAAIEALGAVKVTSLTIFNCCKTLSCFGQGKLVICLLYTSPSPRDRG